MFDNIILFCDQNYRSHPGEIVVTVVLQDSHNHLNVRPWLWKEILAGGSGKFLTHFLQLTDSHFYHRLPTATLLPGDFRVGLFLERDLCFWLQNKDLIIVGGSCPKGLRCSDALSQLPAEEIHWTDSKIFGKYESITKHVNIGSRIKNTRITFKM